MFVANNQFYVFIACVSIGTLFGVFYSPIVMIKEKVCKITVSISLDIIYFFLLSICFLFCSYFLKFPSLRGYMLVGIFLGIYLYFKSFHYMLAKVVKRVYNRYKKSFDSRKKLNDRRKNQEVNYIDNGGGSVASLRAFSGHDISTRCNKNRKNSSSRA